MRKLTRTAAWLAALTLLAGCSGGKSTRDIADYRQARTLPPLEVPPDLTSPVGQGDTELPAIASAQSDAPAAGGRTEVLPKKSNVAVMGQGADRWLLIDAAPDAVWNRVRSFWVDRGFELRIDEPAIGILETQWAENRADVPEGLIRNLLGKVLDRVYSAPTRDKFRVRLEPAGEGRTELFLTHYGVEQVVVEQAAGGSEDVLWRQRPTDPELANEMLNRLLVHLGVDEDEAEQMLADADEPQVRAELVTRGGEPEVLVREQFARTWRRAGIALDRIGFVVEDRDRSEGVYFVRYVDRLAEAGGKSEKGWFARLFSGDEQAETVDGQKLQVRVSGDERESRVRVQGADGEPLAPERARSILSRLAQQLR